MGKGDMGIGEGDNGCGNGEAWGIMKAKGHVLKKFETWEKGVVPRGCNDNRR